MGRLSNLSRWLPLEKAAKRLALSAPEEDVGEADLLRLALDGELALSVHFVNHAKAKRGRVVDLSETEWSLMPPLPGLASTDNGLDEKSIASYPESLRAAWLKIPAEHRKGLMPVLQSLEIGDGKYLNLEAEVVTLEGVYDLCMIGNEQIDVESYYQDLTRGPEVTLLGIDGAFVADDEYIYQIQESFEDYEHQPGSRAQLESLQRLAQSGKVPADRMEQMLAQYEVDRNALSEQKQRDPSSVYYPAGGLPGDSVLVVRTSALRELEERLTNGPRLDKPVTTKERQSAKQLIAVLATMVDHLASEPYKAAGQLLEFADIKGLKIPSENTIVKWLKED